MISIFFEHFNILICLCKLNRLWFNLRHDIRAEHNTIGFTFWEPSRSSSNTFALKLRIILMLLSLVLLFRCILSTSAFLKSWSILCSFSSNFFLSCTKEFSWITNALQQSGTSFIFCCSFCPSLANSNFICWSSYHRPIKIGKWNLYMNP